MTITPKPRTAQPDLDKILLTLPAHEQERIERVRRHGELLAAVKEAALRLENDRINEDQTSAYVVDIILDVFGATSDSPIRVESSCSVGVKTLAGFV